MTIRLSYKRRVQLALDRLALRFCAAPASSWVAADYHRPQLNLYASKETTHRCSSYIVLMLKQDSLTVCHVVVPVLDCMLPSKVAR